MSKFLDRFRYFKQKGETFADGHGQLLNTNRDWEDGYRQRWQHDKIVRSTHGVNCTGSCSWKIYVKNGLVTWETQQTDYPRTRPDLPNHEPRGCPRGASYSWYLYSANRLKYPMMRKRLMKMWREAKALHSDPVEAWASIIEDADKAKSFKQARGRGGFVRSSWQEVNELIAASNVYTIKNYGPDRVAGFSPIPAMSMVSYASGARYLSLIGGTCLSFYDWYCDLPPASPQTWGEQTDVPESADWYNSSYIIAWGSNVPQTRTPDAHFFTEVRYKGTKTVAVTPDYAEIAKLCDLWLAPKQGTDAAMALAMGHVMLREFHLDNPSQYFTDYVRRYTDMPMLVMLEERDGYYAAGRMLRAADLVDALGQENNPEWKTVAFNTNGEMVAPNGSIGFRWGEKGKWNLEQRDGKTGEETELQLSLLGSQDEIAEVGFPYFGGDGTEHFNKVELENVLLHKLPVKRLQLADGSTALVTTVYDLTLANYGLERGLNDVNCATSYDDVKAYTPAWAEQITGVSRSQIIRIAREFADNADKTHGRSMIIVGAGLNHWYHLDMNYRGLINMLIFCGCVGQSGGGWAHYVGQEKLRPQTGWQPLAFALDWQRPARHMNSTSYFYNHSSQWRYETVTAEELLSPMADKSRYTGHLIDFNVRAERMGWLPSAPQLGTNPLTIAREAEKAGMNPVDYTVKSLKEGSIRFAAEQPENGKNHPRNLFIWRSNLLGSSGKGHEFMLKYLLGTEHGIQGKDLGQQGGVKPEEVDWQDNGLEGKLDLVVTLDFRLSSTCLYSDIILPTATWYEKDDMNTSDMHPFIHPLSAAVDPAWEAKSDWEIYKAIAKKFSEVCVGHLGKETDIVTLPIQHDSAAELAQPLDVKDWKFENTFMMYLPRLCEHCLNPACVATCPSGAIYKREEDGIVLIDQDKCRGWRMCITGCPYKKIYFNWKSGKSEKCIFCYPRIEAGQPTICSETCVGRIRYLGVLLYDADAIERAASTENEKDLYQRQLDVFLDPNDPKVIEQAIKDGIPLSVIEAAQQSPVYKMAMEWKLALPLHPEYRTLPMVWYVPPLSPIQSAADAGELGSNGILPDVESLRIPVQYLANLLTAGDTKPVLRALKRMLAMRHYKRAETVDGKVDTRALEEVGLTEAQAQEMYRYLAIANYEDRFVVPSSHRELAREAFPEKNGCGFTFGDGCHGSDTKFNLFNSRRIDAIDVTSKTEPHP
ncbi:TPA: nitrate reductase subunit alpha [Escherichia coli]